jgi:tyrosyl-tRNA synthetase
MKLTFSADDITSHGVAEIIDRERIESALSEGATLKIKFGIDPTSPNIHLGRSIPLWKLRAFQELGHEIHLIIGDFTGQVGDTSDKESERPMLSAEQVVENMARYEEQLWMILNPEQRERVHFHHNGAWLSALTLGELTRLADAFSVNSFIKRELISRRLDAGERVSLREMLYPLMQGFDSVQIGADVELGGTDQRFNLLAGRTLQEQSGKQPQAIIMNQLINGTDGRKMSSSWGNIIALLDSPQDKFGKMMTVNDSLMAEYLLVLPRSVWPFTADELQSRLEAGENPRDLKLQLAWAIVALYHGDEAADDARAGFISQFSEGHLPDDITEVPADVIPTENGTVDIVTLLTVLELAASRSEARRLIEQGGVKVNSEAVTDVFATLTPEPGLLVQVGKRRFVRLAS